MTDDDTTPITMDTDLLTLKKRFDKPPPPRIYTIQEVATYHKELEAAYAALKLAEERYIPPLRQARQDADRAFERWLEADRHKEETP